MSVETQIILSSLVYKLFSLGAGVLLAYLGYRLFMAGVWGSGGDVEAKFRETSVVVKEGAPGTFFAICGAIVICFTVFKGMDLESWNNGTASRTVLSLESEVADELPEQLPF